MINDPPSIDVVEAVWKPVLEDYESNNDMADDTNQCDNRVVMECYHKSEPK